MANAKDAVQAKFRAALDTLVERIKQDRSVLAVILCGSLSHDTVWEKSDIDLVLVTVDERKLTSQGMSLYADGINVHANLVARAEFRKMAEGAIRNSFWHSLLAKGRLMYTHDETIRVLCEQLLVVGERDTQVQLLSAANVTLPSVYKAHKWFLTRGDLDYTALWILHAANGWRDDRSAGSAVLDREALPVAMELNPKFFRTVYGDAERVEEDAKRMGASWRRDRWGGGSGREDLRAVVEHLVRGGEARSATEIEDHFKRNFGVQGVTGVLEYLADRGILGKVAIPVKLTKNSNVQVEELGFFFAGGVEDGGPDEW